MMIDCISRAKAIEEADKLCLETGYDNEKVEEMLRELPSVTPQEPKTFKWCTDCKEYDQEKHCCHRWSKVIRDTVEDMRQEYIEREVLDKIRAEIESIEHYGTNNEHDFWLRTPDEIKKDVLTILDKYKAEVEPQESEDKE